MTYAKREPNGDPIIERIEKCLKEQKKTKKELMQYIGINDTNFTNWKFKKSKGYMIHIDKISEFLDVGTQYLLYGSEEEENSGIILTDEEKLIIKKYRSLSFPKRTIFVDMMSIIN